MSLRYALLHILRSINKGIAIIAVSMAFIILILSLNFVLTGQKNELENVMETTLVPAVVTNNFGTKYDNLDISSVYVDLLFNEKSQLAPYIKEPCVKRSIMCDIIDANGAPLPLSGNAKLVGLSNIMADTILSESTTTIRYMDGYDENIFKGEENVCLINEEILDLLGGDVGTVRVDFSEAVRLRREFNEEAANQDMAFGGGNDVGIVVLTVAGVVSGGVPGLVYCPYEVMREIDSLIYGFATADSMSFMAADNSKLNEMKDILRRYFLEVTPSLVIGDRVGAGALALLPPPALIVQDAELIRVITPVERSILFLQAVIPVLLALAVAIGFLASYLFMRNRKQEFAIMRSLGTKKLYVFMAAFDEQLILSVAGIALGATVMAVFGAVAGQAALYCLFFLACFMLGSAVAVWNIISVNVMKIMKSTE